MTIQAQEPKPPRRRSVRSVIADENGAPVITQREVTVTGAEAEANVLVAKLAPVFSHYAAFYAKEYAGSGEDPIKQAEALEVFTRERAPETPPEKLTWHDLSAVARADFPAAIELWEKVKQAAREELAVGALLVETLTPEKEYAMDRARFLAMREEMTDGWQPQSGIERALIDMLVCSYFLWLEWTGIAHGWATGYAAKIKTDYSTASREWKVPQVKEVDAVEHANRLADGYNRQFLRVLRQLRDLRRYTPSVIVNNGGQVNVANQQVNVASTD